MQSMDCFLHGGEEVVDKNEKTCMGHVEFGMLFKYPVKVSDGW